MAAIDYPSFKEQADRVLAELEARYGDWRSENKGFPDDMPQSDRDVWWCAHGMSTACEQIKEQADVIKDLKGKLKDTGTPESLAKALSLHHGGERVAPVSDYCEAFYDWQKVIGEKAEELEQRAAQLKAMDDEQYFEYLYARHLNWNARHGGILITKDEYREKHWEPEKFRHEQASALSDAAQWGKALRAMNDLHIFVFKSSFLARRIYGGEKLRTEKCPVHEGRWSGLPFEKPECSTDKHPWGCELTGWMPAND